MIYETITGFLNLARLWNRFFCFDLSLTPLPKVFERRDASSVPSKGRKSPSIVTLSTVILRFIRRSS